MVVTILHIITVAPITTTQKLSPTNHRPVFWFRRIIATNHRPALYPNSNSWVNATLWHMWHSAISLLLLPQLEFWKQLLWRQPNQQWIIILIIQCQDWIEEKYVTFTILLISYLSNWFFISIFDLFYNIHFSSLVLNSLHYFCNKELIKKLRNCTDPPISI